MTEEAGYWVMLTVLAAMVAGAYWVNRKSARPPEEDPILVHIARFGFTAMGLFPFAAIVSLVLLLAWVVLDFLWVG
jgi:hypothetical protein